MRPTHGRMSGWQRACGGRSWTVRLHPGSGVPSITALSQESGHARQTCGKAMQLLEREELLRFIPGLGYYVTPAVEAPSHPTHDVRCR